LTGTGTFLRTPVRRRGTLCIAAEADLLVTGDKDLLAVDPGSVAVLPDGLKIVTPRLFLEKGP